MRFLKENLFLVVTAAVVLLGGGAMVAGYLRLSGDVNTVVAERRQLADNLSRLAGGGGANAKMVEAAQKKVEEVKAAVAKVEEVSVDWNRRNFPVLQLPGEGGRLVPAFPIDPNVYRDQGLDYVFTRVYLQEINKLLAGLKPTTSPTDRDIDSQVYQWETRLSLQRQAEDEKMRGAGVQGTYPRSSGVTVETVQPTQSPYSDISGAGSQVSNEASEKGRNSAMVNKAKAGFIYANPSSLDMYFTEEIPNRPFNDLWQAQLNLWVTSDIVEAINKTNQEVLDKLPVQDRNLLNAPVKHLVKITVNENYVQAAPEQAAPTPVPTVTGTGEREYYEREENIARPRAGGETGIGTEGKPEASLLTSRGSNKDFDVLHYSFTVVVSPRYLAALERNLMARNYHTIIGMQLDKVGETGPPGLSEGASGTIYTPGSATGAESNLFYYGLEAVVQVQIDGELLLLTSWERGIWDEENKRFTPKFPPLVPVEALQQQFPGPDNAALRPEDVARLPQQPVPAVPEGTEPAPPPPPSEE